MNGAARVCVAVNQPDPSSVVVCRLALHRYSIELAKQLHSMQRASEIFRRHGLQVPVSQSAYTLEDAVLGDTWPVRNAWSIEEIDPARQQDNTALQLSAQHGPRPIAEGTVPLVQYSFDNSASHSDRCLDSPTLLLPVKDDPRSASQAVHVCPEDRAWESSIISSVVEGAARMRKAQDAIERLKDVATGYGLMPAAFRYSASGRHVQRSSGVHP
jgi:hypothetical protein